MSSSAFILAASRPLTATSLSSSHHITSRRIMISRAAARRVRIRMNTEGENATETKPIDTTANPDVQPPVSSFEAPSFDTEVFSNFVDSATEKIEEFQQKFQDIDTEQLGVDAKDTSIGLVDNFLAGDWLDRGELYGGIQLVFVFLLLRDPGLLNGLVSFVTGPVLLFLGAFMSGKAVFDLGRRQLSIWPAPIPNAELKTDGLYEYVRHPIYAGLILASIGFSVSTGSTARLAITVAMAAFLVKKIDVEEEFLRDAYPSYDDYASKVPSKIIPKVF